MATKAQKIRLSVFLIISSSILLLFFIILVGNRLLKRMDTYYVIYEDISVTGLELGAAVKFHGVQVGRVTGLAVKDAASIIVEIEVERGTPIKKDIEAVLTMVGITGLKFVELLGGSEESEQLPAGGTIIAGQSSFEIISGRAEIIMAKLEMVLNNLNEMTGIETTRSIQNALNSFNNVSSELDTLLKNNRLALTNTILDFGIVMNNLISTTEKVDSTMTTINTIIQSGDIRKTVSNINQITGTFSTMLDSLRVAEITEEFRNLLNNANNMVTNYDLIAGRAREDILSSLRNLEETLDNLREATDVIRENPSVLLRGRRTTGDRVD
ncbi:MAG TPA: MCE family protein [bacterium]|nr:MCE family protein [bacterium]